MSLFICFFVFVAIFHIGKGVLRLAFRDAQPKQRMQSITITAESAFVDPYNASYAFWVRADGKKPLKAKAKLKLVVSSQAVATRAAFGASFAALVQDWDVRNAHIICQTGDADAVLGLESSEQQCPATKRVLEVIATIARDRNLTVEYRALSLTSGASDLKFGASNSCQLAAQAVLGIAGDADDVFNPVGHRQNASPNAMRHTGGNRKAASRAMAF